MPGWAGSSWYYLRYMSPGDDKEFVAKEALEYWKQIDLYVGGAEHATGHLLYFRFWTKFLKDRGWVPFEEPAKKLVNQGMIQGVSQMAYLKGWRNENIKNEREVDFTTGSNNIRLLDIEFGYAGLYHMGEIASFQEIMSADVYHKYDIKGEGISYVTIHIPLECVVELEIDGKKTNFVDLEKLVKIRPEYRDAYFVTNDGRCWHKGNFFTANSSNAQIPKSNHRLDYFKPEPTVEKMSKSKYNVINPDEVISKYGADCFRMYEMFLGPIEASKPWDTKGIDGVSRFLRKFWRLFYDDDNNYVVTDEKATDNELKVLHKTIKKVAADMENLSFNTSVSAFMICLNELTALNCHKKEVLEKLLVILCPFAPHICEYLWQKTGHEDSVVKATFPEYDEKLLEENTVTYPVAINGKVRDNIVLPTDASDEQIKSQIMELEGVKKWLDGKPPKKVIVVKGKMVNVVV